MTQSRTTAVRTTAAELNDATHMFKESDDERAPNFALLPTGEKANRVIISGAITEVNDIGNDSEYWQAKVSDGLGGIIYAYAGQYQQEALNTLRTLEAPAHVVIVGKPDTYETDDGDTRVTLQPEYIQEVEKELRTEVSADVAAQMIRRVQEFDPQSDEMNRDAVAHYDPSFEDYIEPVAKYLDRQVDSSVDVSASDSGRAAPPADD